MRHVHVLAPALVLAALTLTACGPGTTPPGESETPKPTETASPTPEPTPEPEAEALTCEGLLSTTLAEYSGYGISGHGAYADKLQSEGNPAYGFYEAGGVFCFVGEMEATALYG